MHGIPGGRVTRRRARSTALTVLTALTLVITTAATSRAAEPPATAKASSATKSAAPDAKTTETETSRFAAGSGEDCTATAPGSQERRAGAVESCVTVTPAPAKAKSRATAAAPAASAAAATAAAAAGSCDITSPGNYTYTRFSYCVTGINITYILRDSRGVEIGRGVLEVSTGGDLSPTATTWSEQVSVTMTLATGDVTSLNAKLRASCDAGCTATKTAPWFGGAITLNQTLTGNVTFSSAQTAGSSASFYTAYAMYVTSPGATATDPNASWKNSRQLRCDDAVGGTSVAGCAVPSVMAVVPMKATSADAGGAVAAYGWAQKNLNGAWGKKGSPLTRSTSGVAGRTASTCGGFTAQPELVDADSCGDFPFGEAKEGGAAGARCVEVIPNLGNGEWDTYVLNDARVVDPASPCVQAHVTPAEKQFADTQLADGFKDQRVIDADEFELPVSTPDTGPHASCLNDPSPIGSLPNGDGWFMNTTEAVPLVNQTVPTSGPGQRPTRAQACLGRKITDGSGTSDPITGWKDAEEFKKASGVSNGLARCHLIAKVLGGMGTTAETRSNLVPCWQSGMNTGTPSMRTYETIAQNMIKDSSSSLGASDAIFYEVTPVYKDAKSTIPVGVTMSANIERASGATEELFPSVYVTNTLQNTGTLNLGN
ncbi:DNA/RNA non-specific endonuclease [Streptomyces sp. ME02-8801-2C]|uniref:DNA/RNA non-specific endonuclease n=1 Tax=Streptomyces sp. ME02-8801-2C TaxID=3028680 RepID=UPI0029BB976B|nr:DNA/RNA non-specific endonuclease [Streptomyces sp. ME02-8801-2C]MDX3458056.1 DNA/RNA non-specific endonuclease [Streptomyces sp. ME02-8801-2C]